MSCNKRVYVINQSKANESSTISMQLASIPCPLDIPNAEPLPCDNVTTTRHDGAVKLRMADEDHSKKLPYIEWSRPITIHTMMMEAVKANPSRAALRYKLFRIGDNMDEKPFHTITYADYYRLACLAARAFIRLGLQRFNGVALMGFNHRAWFIGWYGAIFAGGLATGVYSTNKPDVTEFVLNDSQSQILVIESTQLLAGLSSILPRVSTLRAIIIYSDDPASNQVDENLRSLLTVPTYTWEEFIKMGFNETDDVLIERLTAQHPNQACNIIYTSGTTGMPKGVLLSHDNITWCGKSAGCFIGIRQDRENLVSFLPLSHVAATVADLIGAVTFRISVSIANPDALKGSLTKTLKEVRPTVFYGVPRVFEKIVEGIKDVAASSSPSKLKTRIINWAKKVGQKNMKAIETRSSRPSGYAMANLLVYKKVRNQLGLDRCSEIFSMGAPLAKEYQSYLGELGIIVSEIYGMSEASGPMAVLLSKQIRVGSCGRSLPGSQIRIIPNPDFDTSHSNMSREDGEISCNGRHVFMGYLNNEAKTRETFDKDYWLLSGDIGRFDPDDYLYITGRLKELIITAGGENVAPIDVEDRIKEALPFAGNVMLIGDKLKYITCLITIKCVISPTTMDVTDELAPSAIRWCEQNGLPMKTVSEFFANASQHEVVIGAIDAAIKKANETAINRASAVQKWRLLQRDFTLTGGELGATLKVRRPVVMEKYRQEIESMYQN